jgi:hypothetical protein
MIESKHRITFDQDNHVIDIGKGQEYGCVRVTVANNEFMVTVHDQFAREIKRDIYPIKRNLTVGEIAFMDAYHSNVGGAPAHVVEAYLRSDDNDKFCEEYGDEYYSGLADALGVWQDAIAYASKAK